MKSNCFGYADSSIEIEPAKKDNHHDNEQIKEKNKNFDMTQQK